MNSIRRFLAVLVLVIVAVILSYLIYTGKAVSAIDNTTETVQRIGDFYG